MKPIQAALAFIAFLAAIIGLGILLRVEGIWETKTLGVAEQNAQTQVYEQSQAHVEGTQRDFDELILSYNAEKDPQSKAAIVSVMRHRAQGVPANQVPFEVRQILGGNP